MSSTPKSPQSTSPTSWLDMRRSDFDREAPLTLFEPEVLGAATGKRHKPDPLGMMDLFDLLDGQ